MSDTLKKGFVVLGVFEGSKAHAAGIQTGDKIIAVNDMPINNVQDYVKALEMSQDTRQISLIRGTAFLEIKLDMTVPNIDPTSISPETIEQMLRR